MLTATLLNLPSVKVYGQNKVTLLSKGQSITARTTFGIVAAAFQWYKNSKPIPGAVKETYVINSPGVYAVQAFNSESCPSPMSDQFEIQVTDSGADVAVNKVSESKQVTAGDAFEYLLTASNKGAAPASNVTVKDTLPANITYVAVNSTSSGAAIYDNASRTLIWSVGSLGAGANATLRLLVRSLKAGTVTNSAVINATEADPDLSNNMATDIKLVNALLIANVFTPNGDGKNESFALPEVLASAENEMQIFNRWGTNIYQKKNYRNEWTGDGLAEGTYFYVLKALNTAGSWETYKGYITLLRSKAI